MLSLLGKNKYKNDWNHINHKAGIHAWIGKLADGTVTTVQTLPWDYRPWGCGSGIKGSCNDGWIQFEICEDNLVDRNYFNTVYKEACELTAYLCRLYSIDPCGSVLYNEVDIPTILCHKDAYSLKVGTNHGDVLHWFKKHGKTMDDVRKDVLQLIYKQIEEEAKEEAKRKELEQIEKIPLLDKAYKVEITAGALNVRKGPGTQYDIVDTLRKGESATIIAEYNNWGKLESSKGWIGLKYTKQVTEPKEKGYKVRVTGSLNVRAGAGTQYDIVEVLQKGDIETIVEEKGTWGKLESGKGWIGLKYTEKI